VGFLGFDSVRAPRSWSTDDLRLLRLAADLLANATQNAERERRLRALNHALKTLSLGNEALVHAADEAQLLHDICRVIVEQGGYSMAWVGFAADGAPRLMAAAGCGTECREVSDLAGPERARSPFARAMRDAQPVLVGDVVTDPDYEPWRGAAQERGYRSLLALPLRSEGAIHGVLSVYNAEAFDQGEVDLLANLAGDLAYGIATLRTRAERRRLEEAQHRSAEQLQRSLLQTIQAIALTVEKRDPYTAGHQQAVARLAAAIARELGLEPGRIEGIRLGAMIHDIGKVYVPAEILNRSGKLSAQEFEIIKSHPQVGYDIIQGVEFPWPVREMVLQHHERLDGSGYPHGLQGDAITPEARILAVADVVEAISAHRPYRPARGLEAALAAIGAGRGTLFDPAAVDACLRLFRDQGFTLAAGAG
jgi:putative nucleotidyltransferase with HDIG domain